MNRGQGVVRDLISHLIYSPHKRLGFVVSQRFLSLHLTIPYPLIITPFLLSPIPSSNAFVQARVHCGGAGANSVRAEHVRGATPANAPGTQSES
jgi:hypothetical protein